MEALTGKECRSAGRQSDRTGRGIRAENVAESAESDRRIRKVEEASDGQVGNGCRQAIEREAVVGDDQILHVDIEIVERLDREIEAPQCRQRLNTG